MPFCDDGYLSVWALSLLEQLDHGIPDQEGVNRGLEKN